MLVMVGALPTYSGIAEEASENTFPAAFDATIRTFWADEISVMTNGEEETPVPNTAEPSNE